VRAAITEHRRYVAQQGELERLKDGLDGVPVAPLPFLFTPDLGLDEVMQLSHELEEQIA